MPIMESINTAVTGEFPQEQQNRRETKEETAGTLSRNSRLRYDHFTSNCNNYDIRKSPSSTESLLQELAKPNTSFNRISKPLHRPHSVASSHPVVYLPDTSSSDSRLNSPVEPESPPYVFSLRTQYEGISPRTDLEILREQNAFLLNKIKVMEQNYNNNQNIVLQPKFTDLYQFRPDQMDFFRRMVLDTKLPPRSIVDFLVDFFLENSIDQMHIIHTPTFKLQYEAFWNLLSSQEAISFIDPLYISLLFSVMAASLTFVPSANINNSSELLLFFKDETFANYLHNDWFIVARQVLAAYSNDIENTDRIVRLQIMSTFKIYLSSTDQFDLLDNCILPQAVMCTYKLKMDCPSYLNDPSLSVLEVELRKRIWWDLCEYDTSRALKLGRKPLIMCCFSNVPFPENCDDIDLNFKSCKSKPLSVQTDTSYLIIQAQLARATNGVFNIHNTEDANSVFKKLNFIDRQLSLINKTKPTFYKLEGISKDQNNKLAAFQANVIHMQICVHRFRLYSSYIPLDLNQSIPKRICQLSIDFLFKKFKYLELLYELDREPIFLIQLEKLTYVLILQLVAMISNHFNNSSVQQDVKMIVDYLAFIDKKQVLFVRPKAISNKVKILLYLKDKIAQRNAKSKDVKLNVNSLVDDYSSLNDFMHFENHDIDYKPTKEELKNNVSQLSLIPESSRWLIMSFNSVLDQMSDKPEYIQEVEDSHKSYLAVLRHWREIC